MNILMVGTLLPEQIELREENVSAAGNRFQLNMLRNLVAMGNTVQTVSYVGMPLSEEALKEVRENGVILENVKSQYFFKDAGKNPKKFCKSIGPALDWADMVVCYNVVHIWFGLPAFATRHFCKSVLVLADYSPASSYRDIAHKQYAKLMKKQAGTYDRVIALSPSVRADLQLTRENRLMLGAIDRELLDFFENLYQETDACRVETIAEETKSITKMSPEILARQREMEIEPIKREMTDVTLVYSGLLSNVTGVDLLLEAFGEIDDQKLHLQISGKGPLLEEVKKAAESDSRITYLGSLPYEDYLRKLFEADGLVNPRNMTLPENKYNFPSKIMDYLAAGKPILSTRFGGWEYFGEVISFSGSSVDELKQGIRDFAAEIRTGRNVFPKVHGKAEEYEWTKMLNAVLFDRKGVSGEWAK